MTRDKFYEMIKSRIVILDGATGTELQRLGMPQGVSPEAWVLEHPETITAIQRAYAEAGADIVYACTFGANRWKLEEFGLAEKVLEMNKKLVQLSRNAVQGKALVAGNLSPTGQFIKPFGDKHFEDAVEVYKEQVKGLLEGGVDLFVIETMIDIQEARAALLAVKESCDLPVMVSLTFNEDQKTLTGTDPVAAVVTLQSLGADVVGCNCSTGPEDMLKVIDQMKSVAMVPLMAKPNAGLPVVIEGKLSYNMKEQQFAGFIEQFAARGINIMGGCCGTTPEYIALLKKNSITITPRSWREQSVSCITSARRAVFMGEGKPVVIVGERINPTGKKKLQAELKEGNLSEVRRFALEQQQQGAAILDVNVGMPGIDEKQMMGTVVAMLSQFSPLPLCIDSANPEVIEAALRIYPGRALVNSISGEISKLKNLLPVAAKYGAMCIILPLDDHQVPQQAHERIQIVEQVANQAREYGYATEDLVVDGLVMTVSADQKAAAETLKVVEWCREQGYNTIMGLSNISFGLPEREWLNAAFLAMAVGKGLSMAIANPASQSIMAFKMASDVLMARDVNSQGYISYFGSKKQTKESVGDIIPKTALEQIYECVLRGNQEAITSAVKQGLEQKIEPLCIVNEGLIPAINAVGELFDRKEYFLPQLIMSAEAMKTGFEYLEPMLHDKEGSRIEKTKIVIATVKGDIHDIGKNIVGLMLKNYGFDVIDLGKDVPKEVIIEKVRETKATIVVLSALMTTTMAEMKHIIKLAKKEEISVKFMVGGAVITKEYAEEIGADGYSEDAIGAVRLAQSLLKQE